MTKPITIAILLLTIMILITGCNKNVITPNEKTRAAPGGPYKGQISELYKEINMFKYDAFLMCLRKGHNNSAVVDSIMDMEFKPTEWPGYTYNNKLREVVAITKEKIKQDSIYLSATWLQDPNYFDLGNKRVIAHCLELYASKELEVARQEIDSITKLEWKK